MVRKSNKQCRKNIKVTILNAINNAELVIEKLECNALDSCDNAVFVLMNAIFSQCICSPTACDNVIGIESCFAGLEKIECTASSSCQNQIQTISNPANNFELICSATSSCQDFTLNINVDRPEITFFKGFICGAPNACNGLIVNVVNTNGNIIQIDKVECGDINSCLNAQFNNMGAIILQSICGQPTSCTGCQIDEDGTITSC